MIKYKSKELLSELKKWKVHTMLVLDFKERNDCKIYHSSTKLIASDSDIGEAFKSMHQSIVKKIKHFAGEYCIVVNVIIKHNIEMFDC